ncbi:MAG: carboxypeptidase regulatory-like domain-containing protein [Myxococcales bacterium]|nr:MAG: carboxypeptidase regulatory-like domain-containing protein [Myxococcales bacterium]
MRRGKQWCGASLLGLALLAASACRSKAPAGDATPASSANAPPSSSAFKPAAPVASGLPNAKDLVSKVVNPQNQREYTGPTGTVKGIVTASGDQAPPSPQHLAKIKGACPEGRAAYSHLFREGMMRSLADVLVAVTGYQGYVPEKQPKVLVAARGCSFSTRTVAMTFGQTLDVVSKDGEAYVPTLLGSRMEAQLLALPGGGPSTLYPPQPGHYFLSDSIKVFMMADVFVVKYPTHDVTSLDGRFEISGIPVGKARLSAMLPATRAVVEKDIEIKAGEPLELAITLPFDAKAHTAAPPSPSAAPAGSVSVPAPP